MVYNCAEYLRSLLLPSPCCLCLASDSRGLGLCPACQADLPWLTDACRRCALPLPAPDQRCGHCQTRHSELDRSLALFSYAAPVDTLIQQFKFGHKLHLARLFARLLAERLQADPRPDCIIPVPLHPGRQRSRGYNQALEIARPLARLLDCRLDHCSCRRLRATATQSLLPAAQRQRNLRDAFGVVQPLQARHVALVDDVMTTGSTLEAVARTLREAGVEIVEAWVCARTLPGTAG